MKTSFILLAAGQSKRMQTDKALLDFHGEPWIRHQTSEILKSQMVDQIIVVDQADKKPLYQKLLLDLEQVLFVENPNPESAPADSLFLAVQNQNFRNGAFVSPIDVPISAEILSQLLAQKSNQSHIVKPAHKGHGGHPVWLSSEVIRRFRQGPQRLDFFIRDWPQEQIQFVEVQDERTQMNLNTPTEWQKFVTGSNQSKN